MNKLDFAMSVIRSSPVKRLTDRTFLSTLGTALGAVGTTLAVWNTKGVPVNEKVNTTIFAFTAVSAVVVAWNHAEKKKDREVAISVLNSVAINGRTGELIGKLKPIVNAAGERATQKNGVAFGLNSPEPLDPFEVER